ncbi:GPO family capsid scaffolding protein [Serratia ureilytica]|uniref:GPO family capsid scaffolding protein n=1 Tax=Serratia ureilytica TaxID=300181 RepID=A0A9X9BZW9_9GAMM|nr:GPO family capsid scaffolding protein [Serratia ureilytica]TXE26920.1 GPO family capsid scaffolding protein [Serratia ureilytica]
MPKVSKKFRVVTEGTTVDGRIVQRNHIQEMAETYNPSVYGARVNLEHLVSAVPNSIFRCYGDVQSVTAEEITDGPLAGKLALCATVKAEDSLVNLLSSSQKVYPSVEFYSKFADTGKAYLVGLGFTDTPASLGTEIMRFNRLPQEHMFATGDEVHVEFEDDRPANDPAPGIFSRVKAMFGARDKQTDERFIDVQNAIELMAEHHQQLAERVNTLSKNSSTPGTTELETKVSTLTTDLAELKKTLSTTDQSQQHRPLATGGDTYVKTDC